MKKNLFQIVASGLLVFSSILIVNAQPYIDIFSARYTNSPGLGNAGHGNNSTVLNYLNLSTNLPFQFKNKKDVLILSPYFERWSTQVQNATGFSQYHYGLVLPVTLIKSIPHSSWSLQTTAIIRMNDATISTRGQGQFGGALVAANYRASHNLVYKFGVYLNGEFFGLFIIPLVGIDWQISNKTALFGILPASMTLEHKLNNHFYAGATFRTFTNSYHDKDQSYIRIDENQLGTFVDYYITKHIVLNLEAGHSLFRKIRTGSRDDVKTNWNANDNFYFKCMIAYRIRVR